MRELRDEKLDFWIQHNLNVLFIGHYGTGKTTRILDAFKRNNLKFKYFSASTMDPWCDFIGVPKVMTDEKGAYLDYILPRDFRDDTVEAIYMDEYNRSHKKVRNAVLELFQFKSINGRPFKNLRLIWAAINPDDEGEYQVDMLDMAQKDRFQVQVYAPYQPSLAYFSSKFNVKQAKVAIQWWQTLESEQQMQVSPRRLEYALEHYNLPGGDIKDILPPSTNPSKLTSLLKTGPIDERMKELFKANDLAGAKKFLQVENNYSSASKFLVDEIPDDVKKHEWMSFFLQVVESEKLTALMTANENVYRFILDNCDWIVSFQRIIKDIITTNTDKTMVRRLNKEIDNNPVLMTAIHGSQNTGQAEKPYHSHRVSSTGWTARISSFIAQPMDTTPQRLKIYEDLVDWLPKTLTLTEAVDTLEILNMLAGRSQAEKLKSFRHLIGVVNHCIDQINKASGLSWNEILTNYGSKFDKLLAKLRDVNLTKKILCPMKKAN